MIDQKFLDELGWSVQNKWLSGRDGSLDRGQSLELIRLAKLGLEYEEMFKPGRRFSNMKPTEQSLVVEGDTIKHKCKDSFVALEVDFDYGSKGWVCPSCKEKFMVGWL